MYDYRARGLPELLQQQGRKQRWLAEQSKLSESHLSRVITGERLVDKATAERVAGVLNVPLFLIFEFTGRSENLSPSEIPAEAVPA
jgi:transcriptional regulator with XRE-family HTH domain